MTQEITTEKQEKNIDEDYILVRNSQQELLIKSMEAVDLALTASQSSESFKDFEALSKLIHAATEISEKLLDHQGKYSVLKERLEQKYNKQEKDLPLLEGKTINTNVFTGTVVELQRKLSEAKKHLEQQENYQDSQELIQHG